MKDKRGYTLIEVLGVIVILAVIATIAVGSYMTYIQRSRRTAYEAAERSMKEAAEGMFTDCMINASASSLCNLYSAPEPDESRIVALNDLITGEYIDKIADPERQGEFCDATKSYVMSYGEASVEGGSNLNLTYKSCLYCSKYQTDGCEFDLEMGKDFGIQFEMRLDSELGSLYHSEWTTHNIWIKVISGDPYQFGIKRIEYATNVNGPWTIMTGPIIWDKEGTTKFYVRATDNGNNVSAPALVDIKIDRTKPTAEFEVTGILGNNDWYTSDVTIGVKNAKDGDGSGVASARVDITSITQDTDGTKVTLTVVDNLGHSNTYEKVIKVDKTPPVLTYSLVGGSYKKDQTLVITASDDHFDSMDIVVMSPSGIDDNLSEERYKQKTKTLLLSGAGFWKVTTRAIDEAGNTQSNSPSEDGWYYQNYTLIYRTYCDGYYVSAPSGCPYQDTSQVTYQYQYSWTETRNYSCSKPGWVYAGCNTDPIIGCPCCTGSPYPNCGVHDAVCMYWGSVNSTCTDYVTKYSGWLASCPSGKSCSSRALYRWYNE